MLSWKTPQFALVAVTTDTELGVATPVIVSGTGGVGTEGGGVFDDGGALEEEPPPPQAAMRHKSAVKPAALRARRSDIGTDSSTKLAPTGE
jgi:hypothetical protein